MNSPIIPLVARIFLALIFIISGIGKLGDVASFTGFMVSGGIPAIFAWPTIALEILGGIALLAGFQTRIVALALAGFTLLAGLLYHFDPADQMQMTSFLKNVAITGGLLLLVSGGAGRLSVDGRMGK